MVPFFLHIFHTSHGICESEAELMGFYYKWFWILFQLTFINRVLASNFSWSNFYLTLKSGKTERKKKTSKYPVMNRFEFSIKINQHLHDVRYLRTLTVEISPYDNFALQTMHNKIFIFSYILLLSKNWKILYKIIILKALSSKLIVNYTFCHLKASITKATTK